MNELCDAFVRYAATYYKDGSESSTCACAVRMFRELFGSRPVGELVHTDMLAVRDALVRSGLARVTVNRYIGIITNRMMPWALDEGLVRAQVKAELSQVRPLKRNRSEARETAPVRPVGSEAIKAAQECMMPNTADMVEVHRLTGMRPAELCGMRWQDIDTSATPWVYRPSEHKNEWRGQPRVILIGPRARSVLERHRATEYPRAATPRRYTPRACARKSTPGARTGSGTCSPRRSGAASAWRPRGPSSGTPWGRG